MSIALGLNSLTDIKFGTNQISSVYLGNNLVWSSVSYILDLYPSAHHAYSLRKLSSTYTGKCLRVRRTTSTPSVTTTTVDVSFNSLNTIGLDSAITYVSGTATTATNLGQFCASILNGYSNPDLVNINQSIFVVTWFDQSGNSKNPTQGTAGSQPRLVNAGNLELSGGKVAVRFVKTSTNFLTLTDTTANINNMSSYFVGAFVGSTNGQAGYNLGTTNRFYFPYFNTNVYAGYGGSATAITLETGFNSNRKLYELISPSPLNLSVAQGWTNGVAQGTRALVSAATANIILGTVAAFYYDGYIQEVIGWQTNVNRLEKEKSINSYWKVF
jgi:hypothetical protein